MKKTNKTPKILSQSLKNSLRVTFLVFISIFQLHASDSFGQKEKVTLNFNNEELKIIFNSIENTTSYKFLYKNTEIDVHRKVNLKATNESLEIVLGRLFFNTNITFEFVNEQIVLKQQNNFALQQAIIGKVTDSKGLALSGVTVLIKNTLTGSITDFDGNFSIQAKKGDVLVFSHVGFFTKEITLVDENTITLTLEENLNQLDEVVVTGYQKFSVNKSTGANKTIEGAIIERKGNANILQSLEGQVAGLSITSDPTSEGSSKFDIRGTTSLTGDSRPLIVVDGFPIEGDINTINPYEVESVTVLKDAASTSIYGARAANGVIVITTKQGKAGEFRVSYNNNFTYTAKPDLAYRLNRVSSSKLIDIQKIVADEAIGRGQTTYQGEGGRLAYARAQAIDIYMGMNEGLISQAEGNSRLNNLRNIDNIDELSDFYLQSEFQSQHNLSFSGGENKSRYRASLNYTKSEAEWVGSKSDRIIFDINNRFEINNKLDFDVIANVTLNQSDEKAFDRNIALGSINSYESLYDENGNSRAIPIGRIGGGEFGNPLFGGKDALEIQRLNDAGLLDESYNPVEEFDRHTRENNNLAVRLQAMFNYKFTSSLTGNVSFQYETGSLKNQDYLAPNSFEMRSLINNTTPLSFSGDKGDLNIPEGARIVETRGNRNSYTLRGQLDYNKNFGSHSVYAIAGSEIRNVFNSTTTTDRLGYDESSLLFRPLNRDFLENESIINIYHPSNFVRGIGFADNFLETKNRFFSFYGNFVYTYKNRYVVSGSARVDQSNLFGTDSKYRYKPFYSTGLKWRVAEEDFFNVGFLNRLDARITYGDNGNIANNYGPFDIANATIVNSINSRPFGLSITNPAISDLRWEKTTTTNFGLDLSAFKNRVSISADYYIKKTTDLIAPSLSDPTSGFSNIVANNANIDNHGFELSINTVNISHNKFRWTSFATFRHNKNMVKSAYTAEDFAYSLSATNGGLHNLEGAPANSFWLFDYVGLLPDGTAQIRLEDGSIFDITDANPSLPAEVAIGDLVNAGTIDPVFTGALTNTFTLNNFNFSFMFVGSGGNVLKKDGYNGDRYGLQPQNVNAEAEDAWANPGDELTTNVPEIQWPSRFGASFVRRSNKNIVAADYIKLREVILGYQFPKEIFKNIQGISLNFRLNNLFYWAKNDVGIDPEAHGLGQRFFPTKTSFTMGLKVDF